MEIIIIKVAKKIQWKYEIYGGNVKFTLNAT